VIFSKMESPNWW